MARQKPTMKLIHSSKIFVPILVMAVAGTLLGAASGDFRASCVKVDITPDESLWLLGYGPRKSEGVHDRLYHRIAAMDDGKMQFFLVSSDLAAISPAFYEQFSRELETETGIKSEQVWWTLTHTHSAPEVGSPGIIKIMLASRYLHEPNPEYSEMVKARLIAGIREARSKLEPARLGVTTGHSMANINRRAIDIDGSASLGMNPDGPVDRQIGLIRLDRLDGSPLALIAKYAMHGTVLGSENLLISGDAQGIVAEYVEEKLGAPMLYINGAAGNIAPIYSTRPNFKRGHITQFNVLLGDRILQANRSLKSGTSKVTLWTGETVIETARKTGFGWVEELAHYLRVTDSGVSLIRIPVRFLKINQDLVLWTAPVELFCEIAINVRNHSPFPFTFFVGYTNGFLGYLPTRQAFAEGGYEPGSVTPFTDQVEDDFTQGVSTYIQGMPR